MNNPPPPDDGRSGFGMDDRPGSAWGESLGEQFGQGQERYYDVAGGMQPTPVEQGTPPSGPIAQAQPAGRRRTALLAASAIVAAVVLGGGVVAYRVLAPQDTVTPAAEPAPTGAAASGADTPSATPSVTSEASPSGSSSPTVAPLTPSWIVNAGKPDKHHGAAYDAPGLDVTFTAADGETTPVWSVTTDMSDTRIEGYGDSSNVEAGFAVGTKASYYRKGFCKTDSSSTLATIWWYGGREINDEPGPAATDIAARWAKAIALKKDLKSYETYPAPTVTQITVNQGKTPAMLARTTIPSTEADAQQCDAKKLELVVATIAGSSGTSAIVITRALDVPNALDDTSLAAIIGTLRPVQQ